VNWLDVSNWLDELTHQDAWVILGIVGGLALLENSAFIGLIVPGEAVVLVGGALAQRGAVGVVPLSIVVFVGAVAGDSVGYTVGRRLMPRLVGSRAMRLGARVRTATHYMHQRGSRAVFFGRFVALVRTIVPVLAGASRMPYRTFLFWNAAGALVWTLVHVSAGYAAGASWKHLESNISRGGLVVAVVVSAVVIRQVRRDRAAQRACPACALDEPMARRA
jgi:membrane protein DedA with SNARE-associated domain